jgi:hypothetical protein
MYSTFVLIIEFHNFLFDVYRVHLPPIGRPHTNDWNDEEYEEDICNMDPEMEMELMEPHSGRIIIYQNGEKTYFLHIDDKVRKGTGDINERVKENVTMMRKLQGLKGRMSDHVRDPY